MGRACVGQDLVEGLCKDRTYPSARAPIAAGNVLTKSVGIVGRLRVAESALSYIGGVETRSRSGCNQIAPTNGRHIRIIRWCADTWHESWVCAGVAVIGARTQEAALITGTRHESDAL